MRLASNWLLLLCSAACASAWGAENPGPSNFPPLYNTRQTNAQFLSAEEAVKTIKLPPGFHATVFASEPDVQQPIAMTMDSRGRLWVAENYTFSEHPRDWDTNLNDRIIILEDTDYDGRFDKRTVFWDRAKKLTSVAVGFGGVFALCPPQLLFIPDANGDDVPDGPPEVLLDGFEHTVIWHTIANGLKLGPDGWLYGRQGIQGMSHVGKPGAAESERVALNVGIWRFHPLTRKFEVVAEGTTNPWGTDWDENGQLFFINTVIGHLWHAIPGAYYKRMYGEHQRLHLYELIDQVADHVHWDTRETWDKIRQGVSAETLSAGGGHAHAGLMIYLGENWPAAYRGRMFAINFHGKRVNSDIIERQGADYTAHHGKDFLTVGDPWFRGIDLLYGPDGGVYMSDWSDIGECHNADGINRTSGRIYKITYGESGADQAQSISNVAKLSNEDLVNLQFRRNEWLVRQARQVLQERAVRGENMTAVVAQLKQRFDSESEAWGRLRAMWGLCVTGGAEQGWLMKRLDDHNEQVRVWAIELLAEEKAPAATASSNELWPKLARMGADDKSGLVLSFVASAMRRAPLDERWPIANALASHSEFAQDRVLPLMLWYGIEPAVPASPARAVALAQQTRMPKLRRLVARRLFEDLKTSPAGADQVLKLLAAARDPKSALDILQGITEALQGIQKPSPPASWPSTRSELERLYSHAGQSKNKELAEVRDLTEQLSAMFGERAAIDKLRMLVADRKAGVGARRKALKTLLQVRVANLGQLLTPLLGEVEIAPDAIRALAAAGEPQTTELLLQKYPSFESEAARNEIINALASRALSANALLDAVQHGLIPRQAVGAAQIQQLRSLKNPEIDNKLGAIWPQLDDSPSGKKALFDKYKKLLTAGRLKKAYRTQGKVLFKQTIGLCHTLFGEGAKIGPELTGADRGNLNYLLENILDPSGVVADNYRVTNVSMKDDRVLSGIVLTKNEQTLTLQTISEKVILPRSEIESMNQSQLSMMPEGLLQALSDQQACDLIAYLMSGTQQPPSQTKQ